MKIHVRRALLLWLALVAVVLAGGCREPSRVLAPRAQTWAEMRVVRRNVTVAPPGGQARPPYPRERLVDGATVNVAADGVAWIRRDGGATFLVKGPAALVVHPETFEITEGRLFVDTPGKVTAELTTPSGALHLAAVRASIDVRSDGTSEAYVLAGEIRVDAAPGTTVRAQSGERLSLKGKGADLAATIAPVVAWEDWTGGLATTDRAAEPAPFGVGTVGARSPGSTGTPRFPLAIQRLDVNVRVAGDFAITEVDELFFNPSSEVVEGIYRFRTPAGAVLHRFGVDREGGMVWGRVKEKQAAAAQYQEHVYQGSTEDPALLEWEAPGVYKARLYPIGPGQQRRVIVRYAEWLGRTGPSAERRMYVYPMAADGAEGTLPTIEELQIVVDLSEAGAKEVRAGMEGTLNGQFLVVREHDTMPRADLAVELFDDGPKGQVAFSAPHGIDAETIPPKDRAAAQEQAKNEAEYVLVPVRAADVPLAQGGLDLAIVVDTSAATDPAALAIARAATSALLAHLGKDDRVAVWAGDVALRPIVKDRPKLAPIDETGRRAILTALAQVERGGATDLGGMLGAAAAELDPARRGAVVYIGDGAPTVGELALVDLRDRLMKLPRPVRVFGLGVGDGADLALLAGLSRGGFAERVSDANAAARAGLRVLEHAERPAWLGASVDLGSAVERVFPRDLGVQIADETLLVIGRVASSGRFTELSLTGPAGTVKKPVTVTPLEDGGDLRRRWAEARLAQMMDEGVGRAALVDLGVRHGVITPFTSLYVPTKGEMTSDELDELAEDKRRRKNDVTRNFRSTGDRTTTAMTGEEKEPEEPTAPASQTDLPKSAADKEGGTGSRAKGEEGRMGAQMAKDTGNRFGVAGPRADANSELMDAPAASAAPAAEVRAEPPSDDGQRALGGALKGDGKPTEDVVAATPSKPMFRHQGPGGAPDPLKELSPPPPAPPPMASAPSTPPMQSGMFTLGIKGTGYGGGAKGDPALAENKAKNSQQPKTALGGGQDQDGDDGWGATRGVSGARARDVGFVTQIGIVRCSGAAGLPIEERALLWRERLLATRGAPWSIVAVYREALRRCEAPTWRERTLLLAMMLDAAQSVGPRVEVWRMFAAAREGEILYRGILVRIRTPKDMRDFHQALGLRNIDPLALAKTLGEAKTAADRVTKLRALVAIWPDDLVLAVRLVDALEDLGDAEAARALGRTLRARPDADAAVRTAVGELFLRLAAGASDPAQKAADEAEGRRTFGEIVELSPDDPVARRRLGDLLAAHGWFADAARQYETLAKLTPEEPTVLLRLAAAAQGLGKLEEAVRWTEKAGASGAPGEAQSASGTSAAIATTYLAWGRIEAREAGRKEEVEALSARLRKILSASRTEDAAKRGSHVTLVWGHPELHPTLWTNALGAPMPAPGTDVTAGVSEAFVPVSEGAIVEVRVDKEELEHAARLRAEAILTVVVNEGESDEKIAKIAVRFERDGSAVRRFRVTPSGAEEVKP